MKICIKKRFIFACILLIASSFVGIAAYQPQERITNWSTVIHINPDATIDVRESISVYATGAQIKRGITRSFPTKFKDALGNNVAPKFELESVSCDGVSVPFHSENARNGIVFYIGDKKSFVSHGAHTYVIHYVVNRHLGFFDDHNELYFNIVGGDVIFPVDKVSCTVHLPAAIPSKECAVSVYTGFSGSKKSNAESVITPGKLHCVSMQSLLPHEAFTIAFSWPSGVIAAPTMIQKMIWFVQDNYTVGLAFLLLIALLFGYLYLIIQKRSAQITYPVFARFYPPGELLPSAISYFVNMKYKPEAFAAEIINMACHGLLTIEQTSSMFSSSYTLHKLEGVDLEKQHPFHQTLFKELFKAQNSVEVKKDQALMAKLSELTKGSLANSLDAAYFDDKQSNVIMGGVISAVFFVMLLSQSTCMLFIILFISAVIHAVFYFSLVGYTSEGDRYKAEIDGFKLFLTTTELDRIEKVGTPPTRTPELYEKYLPYAIAFGVEKAWSSQFAPIFASLEARGEHYSPLWYHGGNGFNFMLAHALSRDFTNAIATSVQSSTIASSGYAPGSTSGSGDRGSSGGGGGGGGAGGW